MRLVWEMPLDFTAYCDGEVMEQREQSDACIDFAESLQNSTKGQFIGLTMKDWDDITNELKRFWWPEDIKEER